MAIKEKQWYVTKYGEVVENFEVKREGKTLVYNVYRYEGNMYQELWDGIYCVYFGEVM